VKCIEVIEVGPCAIVRVVQHRVDRRGSGDLVALLAEDIAFTADGGGKVKVVRKVCNGMAAVTFMSKLGA